MTIFPISLILLIGMAAAIHALCVTGQRRLNVPRLYSYPAFVVLRETLIDHITPSDLIIKQVT